MLTDITAKKKIFQTYIYNLSKEKVFAQLHIKQQNTQ